MPGLSGLTGPSGLSGIFGGGGYIQKVLGYGPIAYWVLNETAGGTAADQVNSPAQDGAYTGVSLANALGPDGVNYAPLFDGANDFVNIYTATLETAMNLNELTIMIWGKVFNAGVWTDGTSRRYVTIRTDASNRMGIQKDTGNNTITWIERAGGTNNSVSDAAVSSTAWHHVALTKSDSANAMKAFLNGSQDGATQSPVGTWAGALDNSLCNIGALTQAPTNPFYGWLAHCAIWASVLSPTDIADLATV